jgi:hypothetical protein
MVTHHPTWKMSTSKIRTKLFLFLALIFATSCYDPHLGTSKYQQKNMRKFSKKKGRAGSGTPTMTPYGGYKIVKPH